MFTAVDWVPPDRRKITPRFTSALVAAAELHAGQRRKGSGPPYVAHLLGVTAIAFDFGANEDEAIGALLHDSIEDAPESLGVEGVRSLIREHFGVAVLDIVEGCTDSDAFPKPPWRARKEHYIGHLAEASASTLLVSASDKLHNVRSIVRDFRVLHDAIWRRFSPEAGKAGTIGYYRGLVTAFRRRQLDGTAQFPRLVDELDLEVTTLETLAGFTGQWPLP
jgi:(p)ppGpp synthase/HD superfamily hydrolase